VLELAFYGYLVGWVLTTVGLCAAVGRTRDRSVPRTTSVPLMVAAGVAWPLLAVGVVEFAGVLAAASVLSRHQYELKVMV
jgi:hypothetical protein